jgi:signal transduction histidine kinase
LRVPIRLKLAGALVVPLVALVVVTVLEVLDTYSDVDEARDQAELATSTIGPPSLLSKLEDERNAASIYLLNLEDAFALPVEDNAEAWAATDRALDEFQADIERRGGGMAETYGPALDALRGLEDVRASVEGFDGERGLDNMDEAARAFDDYSAIMDTLFAANQQVIVSIHDTELRQGAELADLSARQTDVVARLVRDLMVTTLSGDRDGVNQHDEIATIGRELGIVRTNEQLIRTKAEGPYRPLAESLFDDDDVQRFPELVRGAIETGTFDLLDVAEASAGDDADSFGYTAFRGGVIDELERQADQAQADADQRLRWYIALAALATAGALLATWLVSRSITRPLHSLTGQAKEMAEHRLPSVVLDILETPLGDDVQVPETVPVTVRTRDEVADVALALNTVQDTAVDLAAEQAVLRRNIADSFVNLGRRNQNLLGRQLDFITELESHETYPDTLASLFRLDHLATRMRRNAESLLVLAGIDPPRKWAAPVRINDVIRSSLGEVEDYQRVVIRDAEHATVVGSAAADVAHLLAELVENALVFSTAEEAVEIRGGFAGLGPDAGYRLVVVDSGFGMDENDLAQANRRLAGAESFTIAPSQYLGHYVAGNLAERHGIRIHLDRSPGGGITATVDLPAALLTAEPRTEPLDGTGDPRVRAPEPALAGVGAGGLAGTGGVTAFDTGPVPAATGRTRTPRGLAKRAPRGPGAGHGPGPTLPSDDLLASLRHHSDNLRRTRPPEPPRPPLAYPGQNHPTAPPPGPAPHAYAHPEAPGDPLHPTTGPTPPSGVYGWPEVPGDPHRPTTEPPALYGAYARTDQPHTPDQPFGPTPETGPHAYASPEAPGGPLHPTADHTPPAGVYGWPEVPGNPQSPATGPTALYGAYAGSDWPVGSTPQPPPEPNLPPAASATTESGLARRVRGAQLPTADPRAIQRGGDPETGSGVPASADDVYGFLTSFTSGVQRGLDDAHAPGDGDDPQDDR